MKSTKSINLFFIGLFILSLIIYGFLYYFNVPRDGMLVNYMVVPIIALYYLFFIKKMNKYFTIFMVLCGISNLIGVLFFSIFRNRILLEESFGIQYWLIVANTLLLLGYVSLIIKICLKLNFKIILKEFRIQIIVLGLLSIYVGYVLTKSIFNPILITSIFDVVYYLFLLSLFSLSLINYFYFGDRKSLYLFAGTVLIVFQEIFGIVYAYLTQEMLYSLVWITLNMLSYYFFVAQTVLKNKKRSIFLQNNEFNNEV